MTTADRNNLVTENMGFAASIALQYRGRGIDLADLVQEAAIAMIDAAATFSKELGKFTTYSAYYIRKRLSLATRSRPLVTIPEYVFRYFPTLDRVRVILGLAASDAEIIAYCRERHPDSKVNPADAIAAQRALSCSSLNVPASDSETRDKIGNLADHRKSINTVDVDTFLSALSDRERQVVTLRYGLDDGNPQTLQAIADSMDLTKARIGQIEKSAMVKMQSAA